MSEGTVISTELKPGWKTTEFWTSVVTAVSGLAVLFGIITPRESSNLLAGINQAIGGILMVVPIVAYAFSRGKAKQGSVDPTVLLQTIATALAQATAVAPKEIDKNCCTKD